MRDTQALAYRSRKNGARALEQTRHAQASGSCARCDALEDVVLMIGRSLACGRLRARSRISQSDRQRSLCESAWTGGGVREASARAGGGVRGVCLGRDRSQGASAWAGGGIRGRVLGQEEESGASARAGRRVRGVCVGRRKSPGASAWPGGESGASAWAGRGVRGRLLG